MTRERFHVVTRGADWVRICDENGLTVANVRDRDPEVMVDAYQLAAGPQALDALEAVLLFHGGGEWTEAKRARWAELLGESTPATTKHLCDFVREALAAAKAPEAPCPDEPHPNGPSCSPDCDNTVPGDDAPAPVPFADLTLTQVAARLQAIDPNGTWTREALDADASFGPGFVMDDATYRAALAELLEDDEHGEPTATCGVVDHPGIRCSEPASHPDPYGGADVCAEHFVGLHLSLGTDPIKAQAWRRIGEIRREQGPLLAHLRLVDLLCKLMPEVDRNTLRAIALADALTRTGYVDYAQEERGA